MSRLVVSTTIAALALAAGAAAAAPLFTESATFIPRPQPCGAGATEGCYSNYVALADLDGDGDLDAVVASGGGYYTPSTTAPMAVYENTGTGFAARAASFANFAGRLRQIAIGDVDGDDDLDVIAPDSWAMQPDAVFVNGGDWRFTDDGAARLGTSSRAGAARLGDLDGDGDLDLVLSDWGDDPPSSASRIRVYANDGTGHFVETQGAVPATTAGGTGTGPVDVDLADLDGDFALDLIVASRVGESLFYRNDGDGTFTAAGADLPDQPGPYVYGPDACDVDGDGDLDLWLDGGGADSAEQLMINDGAGHFTDETAARVSGNGSDDDNEVQCADLDGDGDLDAVVASLSGNERLLVNDGTGRFAAAPDAFPTVRDATLGLDLGDLDGDGRLDAITAQGEIMPYLNRVYLGAAAQPVDTVAPRLRGIEPRVVTRAGRTAIRVALSDRATSDSGPRLRTVELEVPGHGRLAARFVGGDLYRAVVDGPLPASLSITVHATDAHGNVAAIPAPPITVAPDGGTVDAGTADAGASAEGDGGGCCGTNRQPPALAVALVALAIGLRRRRLPSD